MVADMAADMEVDKVDNKVADMVTWRQTKKTKNEVDVCTKTKLMYA